MIITCLRFRLTALQKSGFYEVFAHHMAPSEQHSNSEFHVIICPMRQPHWTDYKISLCVCESVSESVSQSVVSQ